MRYQYIITLLIFSCFFCKAQEKEFIIDQVYNPVEGEAKNVAVVYFGGSEGGLPNFHFESNELPNLGYPTLGVGYFGTTNTPERLELIPIEYIIQAITSFVTKPEIKGKKVVISGISKGAELALLVACKLNNIDGVITMAPSSVAWQGIYGFDEDGGPISSWSLNGKGIDFVPYAPYDYSKLSNGHSLDFYTKSLNQEQFIQKALIKVEDISGPIYLFSGEEDKQWPAKRMGEMIINRLQEKGFDYEYKHFSYPDVNHGFSAKQTESQGGTKDANQAALKDFENKVLELLGKLNSM
jgi:dienelactone hydrolase